MEILLPALVLALIVLALLVLAAPGLAVIVALVLPVAAVIGLARLVRPRRRPAQAAVSRPPRAAFAGVPTGVAAVAEPPAPRSRPSALGQLKAIARQFRSEEALFAFDRDLTVVSWNEGAAEMTGIPAENALGRHCWELLGGVDARGNCVCHSGCQGARLASNGSPAKSQLLMIRTATGARRAAWLSTIAVRGGDEPLTLHLLRSEPEVAERAAATG